MGSDGDIKRARQMLPELMPSGTREAIEKKRNEESVFGMEAPSLSSLSGDEAGYTPRSVTHGVTGSPS
jgi:hypothetical protein